MMMNNESMYRYRDNTNDPELKTAAVLLLQLKDIKITEKDISINNQKSKNNYILLRDFEHKPWHNPIQDKVIRIQTLHRIRSMYKPRGAKKPQNIQYILDCFEAEFYYNANSRDEYINPSTLKDRIKQIILWIGNKLQTNPKICFNPAKLLRNQK
jgi:hypothetical protein